MLDCFAKHTAKTERKELRTAESRLSQVKQRILEERISNLLPADGTMAT